MVTVCNECGGTFRVHVTTETHGEHDLPCPYCTEDIVRGTGNGAPRACEEDTCHALSTPSCAPSSSSRSSS